ncbi:MAG: hypothetical protein KIT34_18625 [Cyanobacteria bacterium TGS_CYA1]|nr:hypothetical protein [Cyanobacteria bacterium TGS_CYA1]
MDILLGKYEIQSYSYLDENKDVHSQYMPCTIQSHLLGLSLTVLLYLIFWTLASNLKY